MEIDRGAGCDNQQQIKSRARGAIQVQKGESTLQLVR